MLSVDKRTSDTPTASARPSGAISRGPAWSSTCPPTRRGSTTCRSSPNRSARDRTPAARAACASSRCIIASGNVTELNPQAGIDYAFDSDMAGALDDFREGHGMERSKRLPGGPNGANYQIEVQIAVERPDHGVHARRLAPGGPHQRLRRPPATAGRGSRSGRSSKSVDQPAQMDVDASTVRDGAGRGTSVAGARRVAGGAARAACRSAATCIAHRRPVVCVRPDRGRSRAFALFVGQAAACLCLELADTCCLDHHQRRGHRPCDGVDDLEQSLDVVAGGGAARGRSSPLHEASALRGDALPRRPRRSQEGCCS